MVFAEKQLRGKLIVSCQAFPGDPLEDVDVIRRIANAVVKAGAAGLRINSAEHITAIRQDTDVPIIGIQKRYRNGVLRITPDFASAAELAAAGATIIALDCTTHAIDGEPWEELIQHIHRDLKLPVMADIATLEEALVAEKASADFVGTTLNGYTKETRNTRSFSWSLLRKLAKSVHIPIIAEGHIATPEQAKRAVDEGAFCVVVGSAITRPGTITENFLRALSPEAVAAAVIGVDLGGTWIKAGIVDPHGVLSCQAQHPTQAEKGRDTIAANVCAAIGQVMQQAKDAGIVPTRIGIASAGAIDARDGSVFAATENLPGWAGFKLCEFIQGLFHLDTYVLNDAQAAALAEWRFGRGRGLANIVSITVGTGVGGGILIDGRLVQGQHGFAGTIGHHVIRADGRMCNCGRRGCLEAYVSTAALLQEYQARSGKPACKDCVAAAAAKISQFARDGDHAAVQAYSALAGYLAEGIANIFNLLDPEAVFLSGGLVEGHPEFVSEVEKQVTNCLHFGSKRAPRVQVAETGYHAGVLGAAAFALAGE